MSTSGGPVPPRSRGAMRIPGALWFAAVAWIGLALVELYAAADSLAANRLDSEADRVATQLGPDAVSGPPAVASTAVISILAAVSTVVLTAALLTGRGWPRFVLVGLGLFVAVVFAAGGTWHAVAAFVLVTLGAFAMVLPSAHRFLAVPDAR
ncbi:hypothetical protein ACFU8R_00200 [Pseudonocardia alni]|uniref:hypothetical protein n=1 Tax=Pseudonocardia alni TaxID=33907 RepID=UPI003318A643